MNDADRRKMLEDIARQAAKLRMALGQVHDPTGTTVLDRIRQAEPGIRAANYDGSRHGSGVSDPTGSAAAERRRDRTASTMRELDQILSELHTGTDRLWRLIDNYAPPRPPSEADRLELARRNEKVDPGCESCARIKSADDPKTPFYSPTDDRFPDGTEVIDRASGIPRLERKMRLCTWCYDVVRGHWRLPTAEGKRGKPSELALHRDDKPVRYPAEEADNVRRNIARRTADHLENIARGIDSGADTAGAA